ncbi:hypothetical protein RJT34_33502 [Clitoria ternatea]|uniref:Peptidase S54 rhomboid domain-containing protein n=1 Tax=Clitoria ternatea TaxID=43366 RepID=A0AAN9EXU3_CLITE
MQSFVRKVVARHSHFQFYSQRIFHTSFSSLPKPKVNHIPSSFPSHPLHHFHSYPSFPAKVRFFLSHSRNALIHSTPTLHFHRHSFNFNHNYNFHRYRWKSWFRGLTPNDTVVGLIVVNVAIFLLWRIADERFMIKNFTISLDNFKSGRLHTLITNAFSHVDTWHIVSNMVGLYFFGTNIGRNFGTEFLLMLYLAGAVGGSVFYLMHQAYKAQTSKGWRAMVASKELALGASGAVNAVMLLDIFLNPKATLYLNFFIPVPAVLLGIFLIGNDMLRIIEGDTSIAGSTHLGGAAIAAIAWAGVRRGRF